ncbi:saccharopine dehydrogenase (NAD+, L-lysine-forming) [Haloferula luteola]|uniref:Saccharopine dehydrogenase (NAD+, L-lysine-forming) n=1 Tax=Haloferula luteola TaxID=595692 RepID=A0A840VEG4_9BACT|nr:saccharopine dehydrogenase family protein [Haloferula luteola]MBB5352250.1 saccharopine dehydrogenase (NAD+, L-lysine-forming) [Haloferula luteola]
MNKVLIIGAGGVGNVVAHKCAMVPEVFGEITLASRTVSKCEAIAADVKMRTGREIATAQVDADNVAETAELIRRTGARLLINVALPYQDLTLMEACLEAGCDYLDTANYEPKDVAKFEYSWQWNLQERFLSAGRSALLGSGFDPGVTNVFTAWALKHHFDEIHTLDIIDVNGGNHGHAFATNFNPEINIREVTAECRHWENGTFVETSPMSLHQSFTCPEEVGTYEIYRMYHEELESLVKHIPTLRRAQFWMSFSPNYLKHLEVLQNVGMTRIDPVIYQGQEIIPLQFLKAVLPNPGDLGERTKGRTCIGNVITGVKDGQPKAVYIYNICDHEKCFEEVGSQAISYTTGVPAMIGAKQMLEGSWRKDGVWNMEQHDPDAFMADLNAHGLPWTCVELTPDQAAAFQVA